MNKARKGEKIFTSAFFILAFLILAGFIPFRFRALDQAVEDALFNAGADSVWIGSAAVTLFKGVSVKGLKTSKRLSPREEYRTSIERVDVSCNLFLLAFWALNKPDLLNFKRDIFMEVYEKPFSLVSDACAMMITAWPFRKVTVRGADIEFFDRKKTGVSAGGASVKIDRKRGAVRGKINVSQVIIPALAKIENFGVRVEAGDGRLSFVDGSGTVYGGKLRADASVNLKSASVLDGKMTIKELDLERFCAQTKFSTGGMSGKVNVSAVLEEGGVLSPDSLKARGNITVSKLTAVNLPLQNSSIMDFVSPELKTLRFSEVKGDYTLSGGKLSFKEILGGGDIMSFKSAGWVGLDGSFEQNFEGVFSQTFANTLSPLVKSSLEETASGGRRFNCRISGTFQNPRVEIDKSVYGRAAGSAVNSVAQGLRNLFK